MKAASEKWNTLTQAQKDEVYALIEVEMNEENKVLDKLVEFSIFEQSDINSLKAFKLKTYNKLKEGGEFPFLRGKGIKNR